MAKAPGPLWENESPPTSFAPTMGERNVARASDGALTELSDLPRQLEYDSDRVTSQPVINPATDNLLVRKRLGIAASLFVADHQAEVVKVDSDMVELQVECRGKRSGQRDARSPGAAPLFPGVPCCQT